MMSAYRAFPAGHTTAQIEVVGALLAPECSAKAVAVETQESWVKFSIGNLHGVKPKKRFHIV